MNYIHDSARIGKRTIVGHFSIVEENVILGTDVTIGNNVTVKKDTIIKNDVTIKDGAIIGAEPHVSKISATTKKQVLKPLIIGQMSVVGYNSVLYRGASIGSQVFIADLASVRENVTIGNNSIIGKGSTIENNVSIGSRCKIQSNVQIVPFSTIENDVFISPGVMTSNDKYAGRTQKRFKEYDGIHVKKGARLGVASITLPGVTIGKDTLVAAGSLVTKNTRAKKIVMGIPAKEYKDVPEDQLLENQK